jgi:hypothetical protein
MREWAREQRDMHAIIICQNEAILAKIEDRPCKVSPEDQKIYDQIFDTATANTTAINAELAKK